MLDVVVVDQKDVDLPGRDGVLVSVPANRRHRLDHEVGLGGDRVGRFARAPAAGRGQRRKGGDCDCDGGQAPESARRSLHWGHAENLQALRGSLTAGAGRFHASEDLGHAGTVLSDVRDDDFPSAAIRP